MLLITSAEYIDGELSSEFGKIPPCFLPIGNRRLYEHQIQWAKESKCTNIYISLPEDFQPENNETNFFIERGVTLIYVPAGLTLGESIAYCWSTFEGRHKGLSILHGDTLFLDIKHSFDNKLVVAKNEGYYPRAVIHLDEKDNKVKLETKLASDNELIVAGFFSFEEGNLFIKELHINRFDFIKSVQRYYSSQKIRCEISENWLDFGHVTSYFRSRASITTQRSFNGLKINKNVVLKSSKNKVKMLGEYSWFSNIPEKLKTYSPNTFWFREEKDHSEYAIEYIYASTLSDLFVFSKHPLQTWNKIFQQVNDFFIAGHCINSLIDHSKFDELYLTKTLVRLDDFAIQTNFDIEKPIFFQGKILPSLKDIAIVTAKNISPAEEKHVAVVHGDLCFSNILYSFRSQTVKLIDPRGLDNNNNITVYGDQRYDLAKFAHSVIGLYDYILAGNFTAGYTETEGYSIHLPLNQTTRSIQELFYRVILDCDQKLLKEIMAINVHLFLSMLPLHNDDKKRQQALMLNGLRLYKLFIENGEL